MKAMNVPTRSSFTPLATLSLALAPVLAHATPGHDASGFSAGVSHPIHGLDHLLAMLAVGLWAAQLGGRAKWLVPASFVGIMALGGALGMAGMPMPFAEQGIFASVLILGVLIAAAARLPLGASVAMVGLFALCHGRAHGLAMPATASGFAYGNGFVIATALLHAAGIGLGLAMQQHARAHWLRATGVAICAASALLVLN